MDNDDIYPEINQKSKQYSSEREKRVDSDRKARSQEDMATEASSLRSLFSHYDDIVSWKAIFRPES
jgi:hypothetical protein